MDLMSSMAWHRAYCLPAISKPPKISHISKHASFPLWSHAYPMTLQSLLQEKTQEREFRLEWNKAILVFLNDNEWRKHTLPATIWQCLILLSKSLFIPLILFLIQLNQNEHEENLRKWWILLSRHPSNIRLKWPNPNQDNEMDGGAFLV